MAQFKSAKITSQGQLMMMQDLNNQIDLQFTRIAFGNGEYTEEEYSTITARTSLKSQKQSFNINSMGILSKNSLLLGVVASNENLSEGYSMTEVGLFAKDGSDENSVEKLYAIVIADIKHVVHYKSENVYNENTGYYEPVSTDEIDYEEDVALADYMPAYNGSSTVRIRQNFQVDVVDASTVTLEVTDSAVVSQSFLEEFYYNKAQTNALLGEKMNYEVLDTVSTISALNEIATDSEYADGNFTLIIPIGSGNIMANLDIAVCETAIMTFHGDYVLLYFPYNNKKYIYSDTATYKWVRVYADIEPNTVPRKIVFNSTTDLADSTLIDDLVDYDVEVNVNPGSGSTIFPIPRTFQGRIYTHAFQSGTNTLRNQFLHTDRGEVFLREKDYNAQSWTSWRRLYVESLPKKHAHFNDTLANTATIRGYIVDNQDEVGRLYISGTDFIEFVDLEATYRVEVLDMIDTTHGTGTEMTMLSNPSGEYYIQTWHKAEGEILRRFKVGSGGTYSAWVSTTPAAT